MSRKRICALFVTVAFLLAAVIPAVAQTLPFQYPTAADYQKATSKSITKLSESPMLKSLVSSGKLPSVDKRLGEFAVVAPLEQIGQYGGTLYTVSPSTEYAQEFFLLNGGTGLPIFHLQGDCKTIVGNIAKSWSFSADGKELTLNLRKINWSDGKPFSADDLMFWYQDVILDDQLTPTKPEMWSPGGKLMVVQKIDNYTVKLKFAVSYPTAILPLATLWNINLVLPKHYLSQFHIKYNAKANDLAKAAGFENWYTYFLDRSKIFLSLAYNTDMPVITPYKLVERTTDHWVMERNPYFWKVDTAGNQLPYIDKVYGKLFTSAELYNGAIIAGQADWALASTSIENLALYQQNAQAQNYRVLNWKMGYSTILNYNANQNVKDPVLRKIFQDVRFRKGLSLAINRQEINESVLFGKGTPVQFTSLPASDYYVPEYAQSYAAYDPEKANQLLDEMGLKWDSSHEYRLRPDGKALQIVVNYVAETAWGMATSINELVTEYWKAIGVKLIAQEVAAPYLSTLSTNNDYDMAEGWGDAASNALIFWDHHFVTGSWGPEWDKWRRSLGKEGQEPPKEVKDNIARWERMRTTLNDAERIRLGKELMKSQADNLWEIGTVAGITKPLVARNTLKNISPTQWYTGDFQDSQPSFPEQYYLEQ